MASFWSSVDGFDKISNNHKQSHLLKESVLLPTRSEEMGLGSIPVAILPSCQYMKILHHNCIDINMVG